MKLKYFIILGFVLLVATSLMMIWVSMDKLNHKEELKISLKHLPQIPAILIEGDYFDREKLPNKPTVILFFNSECNHCQYEATAIQGKLKAFENATLLFVSDETEAKISAFSKAYKLDNNPNTWWLKIQPKDVYSTFGTIGVPHIWVYNAKGNLVKEFKGETKVEALLEWL